MEPNGPEIDVSDFVMFKKIIAIVMLQEMNPSINAINKAFGYKVGKSSSGNEGPVFLDNQGLAISSSVNKYAKINSWTVQESWEKYLSGSIIYFCTNEKDSNPTFHPSACYYMSSKNEDLIHLMDSAARFDMILLNIEREKLVTPINMNAVQESFFQNSTVQGDYAQWYSVWRLYMDSFCKYHNIHGLHFYSVLEPESVQEMYDLIPKGMWTTMADMHHEYFMHNFAPDLF